MAVSGKSGYISVEGIGTVCDITDWTINIGIDEIENTPINVVAWRTFVPGLISATGSFTSYSNYLTSDLSPQSSVNITFYTPDGTTFLCDQVFVTNCQQSVNVLGLVTYTYNIRFGEAIIIS